MSIVAVGRHDERQRSSSCIEKGRSEIRPRPPEAQALSFIGIQLKFSNLDRGRTVGEPRATADGRGRRHAERIIFYRQALMSNATTRAAVAAAPPAPTQRQAPDTGSVVAPPDGAFNF